MALNYEKQKQKTIIIFNKTNKNIQIKPEKMDWGFERDCKKKKE